MELLDTIFRGLITLSLIALMQSCSITDIKSLAIEAHKKGPMSYKKYTRELTK